MALNRWGYPNDVGLITRTDQLIQSLTKVTIDTTSIEEVITNAVSDSDEAIINKIDESTTQIIDAMPECCGGCDGGCGCDGCTATMCDVKNAVREIKSHIDKTFNGENPTQMFSNINEIYNKVINEG